MWRVLLTMSPSFERCIRLWRLLRLFHNENNYSRQIKNENYMPISAHLEVFQEMYEDNYLLTSFNYSVPR